MESNTKLQTAGVICAGIMKILGWILLIGLGFVVLMCMVALECAKPKKNNYC
jgi:hypothetical protein